MPAAMSRTLRFPEGWCAETTAIGHMVDGRRRRASSRSPSSPRSWRSARPAAAAASASPSSPLAGHAGPSLRRDRRAEDAAPRRALAARLRRRRASDERSTVDMPAEPARRPLGRASRLVLGSGLGGLVDERRGRRPHPLCATSPAFPHSAVTGHAGELVVGRARRRAGHHPLRPRPLLREGRCRGDAPGARGAEGARRRHRSILTNAAGSLREDLPPGSVMLITDHINYSGAEPADRRAHRRALRRHDRGL